MKKQLITFGAAVCVFAALLGAYFFTQAKNKSEMPEETEAPARSSNILVLDRPKEDLESVSFFSGDSSLTFLPTVNERYNRVEWELDGYDELDIDTSAMDSMVTPVYYFAPVELIDETDDNIAEYGLDTPAAYAVGNYKDGSTETVSIGKKTPGGDYYYAKLTSAPGVYLMYTVTGDRFFNTILDLVKKDLPGVYIDSLTYAYLKYDDVYEIEFGYMGTEREKQREIESFGMVTLKMLKPYPGRDVYYSNLSTFVLEYLEALAFNAVVAVLPEDLSAYGLAEPKLEMIFTDIEDDTSSITIGSDIDEEYAYAMVPGRPVVYSIKKSLLTPFYAVDVYKLLDKFVALVNIANCEEIHISSAAHGREHVIVLNHEIIPPEDEDGYEEDIIHPEIDGLEVEELPFKTYYQSLIGLLYDVEIKDYEKQDEAVMTVRYVLNGENPDVVAEFYPYNNDFYAVQRDGNPIQFVVNKRSVDNMFDTLDRLVRGEIKR